MRMTAGLIPRDRATRPRAWARASRLTSALVARHAHGHPGARDRMSAGTIALMTGHDRGRLREWIGHPEVPGCPCPHREARSRVTPRPAPGTRASVTRDDRPRHAYRLARARRENGREASACPSRQAGACAYTAGPRSDRLRLAGYRPCLSPGGFAVASVPSVRIGADPRRVPEVA